MNKKAPVEIASPAILLPAPVNNNNINNSKNKKVAELSETTKSNLNFQSHHHQQQQQQKQSELNNKLFKPRNRQNDGHSLDNKLDLTGNAGTTTATTTTKITGASGETKQIKVKNEKKEITNVTNNNKCPTDKKDIRDISANTTATTTTTTDSSNNGSNKSRQNGILKHDDGGNQVQLTISNDNDNTPTQEKKKNNLTSTLEELTLHEDKNSPSPNNHSSTKLKKQKHHHRKEFFDLFEENEKTQVIPQDNSKKNNNNITTKSETCVLNFDDDDDDDDGSCREKQQGRRRRRRGGDGDSLNNNNDNRKTSPKNNSIKVIQLNKEESEDSDNSCIKATSKSCSKSYELEEEATEEEILGLEFNAGSINDTQFTHHHHRQDYEDIVLTSESASSNSMGANINSLNMKYESNTDNNNSSSSQYSHQSNTQFSAHSSFPKNNHYTSSTGASSYNNNEHWYHSPANSETLLGSSLSYIVDGTNSSTLPLSSSLDRPSSIWDGMNSLCGVRTCSKLGSKKCPCKAAFYCSEEHQKQDWKDGHRKKCISYKMEIIDEVEKISAMKATRNIEAGKLIFSEQPFLVFPHACQETDFLHIMDFPCVMQDDLWSCNAKQPACLGCMKIMGPTNRRQCSKCCLPLCSFECEYSPSHSLGECSAIQKLKNRDEIQARCFHTLYLDVEILRALMTREYDRFNYGQLLEFRNHVRVDNYKRSDRFAKFTRKMKNRLVPLSAKVSGYNYDLISDLHSIITALAFKPSLKSPYKMLIYTQLLFTHDCIPNSLMYIENQGTGDVYKMKCIVKSAVPIMKGEIISLDFLPCPYLNYPLRRKTLENLYLNCECGRCKFPSSLNDNSSHILCSNCRRGHILPETPMQWKNSVWSCNSCQEEFGWSYVKQVYEQWRDRLSRIPKTRKDLYKLLTFIEEGSAQLHPTHELVIMGYCFVESIIRPTVDAFQYPDANRVCPHKLFVILNFWLNTVTL